MAGRARISSFSKSSQPRAHSWREVSRSRVVAQCALLRLAALAWWVCLAGDVPAGETSPVAAQPQVVVEAEEEVYKFTPANNGAGPMWCSGSTCLVRIGDDVFASGLETLPEAKPLNNCRWTLFHRERGGWRQAAADATDRTREPSPLAAFPDGRLLLSANPTLATNPDAYSGPARPEILEFSVRDLARAPKRILPQWDGKPSFTEHSYRSFAADGPNRELILFQNIGYTHAEWAFRDRAGEWHNGRLPWPDGKDYPQPQPIRVCYPNVLLQNRAVYFCGVSDIVEPNPEWRAFKKQLTGQEWDYDFRRLFFTWCPDLTTGKFAEWIEIASRDKTCGWISPGDLWVGPDGTAHIVWTERALDERLRTKFFPEAKQRHAIEYAAVRAGKVVVRRTLLVAEEGKGGEVPSAPRFQVTPDNRLFLICHVQGKDAAGQRVSENRLMQILAGGQTGPAVRVGFKVPFISYFTATTRGGSPPANTLELLGLREGASETISYARVRLR